MDVYEAEEVMSDPINAMIVIHKFSRGENWATVAALVGLPEIGARRRGAKIARASRVITDSGSVETFRDQQILQTEQHFDVAVKSWHDACTVTDKEGHKKLSPSTRDIETFARVCKIYQDLLTDWVGTRAPKQVHVDGLARSPIDVELEKMLAEETAGDGG